jgi:hypothetical protein
MSTLVGIALTKGDLKSLDQTLGELLPHAAPVGDVEELSWQDCPTAADHDGRLDGLSTTRIRPGRSW